MCQRQNAQPVIKKTIGNTLSTFLCIYIFNTTTGAAALEYMNNNEYYVTEPALTYQ